MARFEMLAIETAEAARAASRWARARAWARRRWPALALAALTAPIAVVTFLGAVSWIGRPFPGFFVMGNGLVPTVGAYGWTGLQAGVPFLGRIVTIDGREVSGNRPVYEHVAALPIGTPVRYGIESDGRRIERTVTTMRFVARDFWLTVGIFFVCGVVASALGIGVGLAQPDTPAARAFLAQGAVTGLYALTGTALYHPRLWSLAPLYCVVQTILPATFIHLVLVFPVPRRFVIARPRVLLVPYAIAGVLIAWLMPNFLGTPPDPTPLHATFAYTAIGLAAFIAVPMVTYWENRAPHVRQQLNVVIPGVVLATVIALWAHVDHAYGHGTLPINLMAITVPLFYASIAYSILRDGLFDVDELVRQAAAYVILSVLATAAWAGSLALGSILVPALARGDRTWFDVAFVVLIALLFEPARRRVQQIVNRMFFRHRLDYRETVRTLSRELTSVLALDEIVARIGRAVSVGFQVERFAVVRWTGSIAMVHQFDAGGLPRVEAEAFPALQARLAAAPVTPLILHRDELAPDEPPAPVVMEVQRLRAALLVPLAVAGRLIGAFAVGARRSGRPFTRSDIELLGTLGAHSAVTIDNAHSFRALQELNAELEDRVHARTEELQASYRALEEAQAHLVQSEKMASLGALVAGVAHEINNPVSFVVNNVGPLEDCLAELGAAAAAHPELSLGSALDDAAACVRLMAEGANRTAAIVNDLRSFSRIADAETGLVDLAEGIALTRRLLQPRTGDRIQVHIALDGLPRIPGASGPLNQVFTNLLANACDAIAGEGNIWVEWRRDGEMIALSVRDDGAGIPPDVLPRVLEPFFTTKPPGQGTGLGLAIVHGIVRSHGGTIDVVSTPGRGTTLTVRLPMAAVARAQVS